MSGSTHFGAVDTWGCRGYSCIGCGLLALDSLLFLSSGKRREGRQGQRVNQMPEISCCETFSHLIPISKARLQLQERQ